jgi:hypothetical protein
MPENTNYFNNNNANTNNQNFHTFSQHSQTPISPSKRNQEESYYSNQFQDQNNYNTIQNNNLNGYSNFNQSQNNSNINNINSQNFQNSNDENNFYLINFDNKNQNSIKIDKLNDELIFDGNVRAYYFKYVDNNSSLMPLRYRRSTDFMNKFHMITTVGCMFFNIMIYANYVPHNMPLAKKLFTVSSSAFILSYICNKHAIKRIRNDSYNEMINKYSEDKIKLMIDKSILINRGL